MDSAEDGGFNPKGDGESSGCHHNRNNRRRHHLYISGVTLKITVLLVVIGITSLLHQSAYSTKFSQMSYLFSGPKNSNGGNLFSSSSYDDNHAAKKHNVSSSFHQFIAENSPSSAKEEEELENILRKASMKDKKAVIITTLNAAWIEPNSVFDLFLESFRIGNGTQNLVKHLVVGTMDQKAHSHCLEKKLHCYALTTEGVDFSGEALFMTKNYLKLVWRKLDFQRIVIESGYDLIFTDSDVMWLRNPFLKFYPDGDFQMACDRYGHKYSVYNNWPNAGFVYVKSNNRTIKFFEYWYTGRHYFPGKNEQTVFNRIKFYPYIRKIGLEIRFLNTAFFGGFCEPSKDLDLVVTMHANCCFGLKDKIHDLKNVLDDWKLYMSLPAQQRNLKRSWTLPRLIS